MNETFKSPIAEYMVKRPITDKIIIDQETWFKFLDIVCPNYDTAENDFTEHFQDLFLSETIPLPNASIEMIAPINNEKFNIKEIPITTTIAPIKEFANVDKAQKILKKENKLEEETLAMTYFHLPAKFNDCFGRITYNHKINDCCIRFEGFRLKENTCLTITNNMETDLMHMLGPIIGAWVCTQIILLHPTLKYIFDKPKIIGFDKNGKKVKKKKQAVSYIRKHKITTGDIDKELFPFTQERGSHTITCPYWYVIGHWRHYKDHKTWIPGYWKGSMRDLKNKQIEPRERKIVTEE